MGSERFPGCLGVMELPERERDRHTRWLPQRNCDVEGRRPSS